MKGEIPNFRYTANEMQQKMTNLINEANESFEKIIKIEENKRTFENTIKSFELAQSKLYNEITPMHFLSLVSTNKEIREQALEIQKYYEKFTLSTLTRYELYSAIRCVSEKIKNKNDEKDVLLKEDERMIEKILSDFQRNGLHLPTRQEREQVLQLRSEITDLCLEIAKNVNEENTKLHFYESELIGMPDSFISQLLQVDDDHHKDSIDKNDDIDRGTEKKYVITLAYPHLFPILANAKNPKTREKIAFAFDSKCPQNVPLFLRLLRLRYEAARLQSYDDDASYMLDIKLAKTSKTVEQFLIETAQLIQPKLKEEIEHLHELKRNEILEMGNSKNEKIDNNDDNEVKLCAWDYRYYQQKRIKTKFSVDMEEVRKYFPFENVKSGVLSIYQNVFSLRFENENLNRKNDGDNDDDDDRAWHHSVECYSVWDRNTNQFYGYFYLDLFPREGKYKHAACWPIQRRSYDYINDKLTYTSSAMVANFSPPTNERPSLLNYSEVQTFFHEFGHVMHSLLSSNKYGRLNWTWSAVEQDFLEVPSMMLENWSYQPNVLKNISSHYQTNEPLPDDMIDAIIRSSNANDGYLYSRLIAMSLFDLYIHSSPVCLNDCDDTNSDVKYENDRIIRNLDDLVNLWKQIMKKYVGVDMQENTIPFASWQHMVSGYNAGYYGYVYSDIIASDLFTRFENEGILSPDVGTQFRSLILEPCALLDGNTMIRNYLQREFNQSAFCRRIGVKNDEIKE